MLPEIPRRNFLRGALATGALLAATRAHAFALISPQRRFARVKVARDRIIREVVGLRPYRAEGFVVAAERLGNKLIVHNYGHGGAGITLSWGTASLAADLLSVPGADRSAGAGSPRGVMDATGSSRQRERAAPRFAVLGSGANGLATALTLQRRYGNAGASVTIYTKDLPPNTTSNIAGGFWAPTSAFDDSLITPTFNEQFRTAARLSNQAFQLLVGPEYGVRWIDTFRLYRDEAHLSEELEGGNDLYPAQQAHRDPDNYFGFPFVRQYNTMLIEPQTYLRALLRDFYTAGGKLIVKEFRDRRELMRLPERVIFNCTGLGARALFNDEKLYPVRGQIEVLLPQPEIDYCYLGPGHMFPRRDGIVLGGTFDHDDWSLQPRADQRENIIGAHTKIMKGLKQ